VVFAGCAFAAGGFAGAGVSFALSSSDLKLTTRLAPYAFATRASERSDGR
jgi:hypothetical protein